MGFKFWFILFQFENFVKSKFPSMNFVSFIWNFTFNWILFKSEWIWMILKWISNLNQFFCYLKIEWIRNVLHFRINWLKIWMWIYSILKFIFIWKWKKGIPEVTMSGIQSELDVRLTAIGHHIYRANYSASVAGLYLLNVTWADRYLHIVAISVFIQFFQISKISKFEKNKWKKFKQKILIFWNWKTKKKKVN